MKKYLRTIILAFVAIAFTVSIKFIDVKIVNQDVPAVGFAGINGAIFSAIGSSVIWDKITDIIMFAILGCGIIFALVGLSQFVKRKKVSKVDRDISMLGIIYVILGVLYVLFEKIIINYRPILENGKIGASFPSSHMMLVLVVGSTIMMVLPEYIKNKNLCLTFRIILGIMIGIMIIGRLLSGMHWFTDIIGGILYGAVLISLYCDLKMIKEKNG